MLVARGCLRNWNQWVRDWARQNWNTTKKAPRFWFDHHPKRAAIWQGRKWQIPIDMWRSHKLQQIVHLQVMLLSHIVFYLLVDFWVPGCVRVCMKRRLTVAISAYVRTHAHKESTTRHIERRNFTFLRFSITYSIPSNLHSTVDSNDNTVFSKKNKRQNPPSTSRCT